MAAHHGRGSKLKTWEHPAKSGIWISEVLNRSGGITFGISFQVTVPAKLAGKRKRKQLPSESEAEAYAESQATTIKKHGQDFQTLSPAEMREIAAALDLLKPTGIGLLTAVEFAVRHMKPAGGDRSVNQVVGEIVDQKRRRLERGSIRPKSFEDFELRTRKFAVMFGTALVKDVSLKEIKAWLGAMELTGRSVKNYRLTVSELMKHAVQKGYRAENPMLGFTREDKHELEPDADQGREPSILSVAEAKGLLQTAFAHPELDLGAAVTLALFCGIRTEELKRMKWSAVRLDDPKPFVNIDRSIAKKRRIRNVEIPACAVAWLTAWTNRSGPIASAKHRSDYIKKFAKLTRFAGFGAKNDEGRWVTAWNNNSMRHSFGSYTYALTGDSMKTAALLGHKGNDDTLFSYYRALVTKADAEAYFDILPPRQDAHVIPFPLTG